MLRLLLLRHAKSDRAAPGESDGQRPLNARGREAAPRMGRYMARHGLTPASALVSSAARAKETWNLMAGALKGAPSRFEPRLYNAAAETIFEIVRETPRNIPSLLVVGHNPGLHALAVALPGSGDIETRRRLGERFPTTALAVIDFAGDDWEKIRLGGGRLERFVSARDLAAIPD